MIAVVFKALAEESRIRIVNLLIKEELCVCEIETILDMSQSNASRHLNKLKDAGIVAIRKESQWVYYRISQRFIEENRNLYAYLCDKMSACSAHAADAEKLSIYRKRGYTCGHIKQDRKTVMKDISGAMS